MNRDKDGNIVSTYGNYKVPRKPTKRGLAPRWSAVTGDDDLVYSHSGESDYYTDGFVLVAGKPPPQYEPSPQRDFSSILAMPKTASATVVLGVVDPTETDIPTAFNPTNGRAVRPGLALRAVPGGDPIFVSKDRFDYVASRFPAASLMATGSNHPVYFVLGDELVGIIMPCFVRTPSTLHEQARKLAEEV